MDTLYERMTRYFVRQAYKHDLHRQPEEYAKQQLNKMDHAEFLSLLSDHLEDMLKEHHG